MNNEQELIVGLDIGSTKICVVVGCINENDRLEILGMGKAPSVGVEKGFIANIDQTVEAIRMAITEAEKQSDVNINVVNVGIAGKQIQTQLHPGVITRPNADQVISIEDINRLAEDMYRTLTPSGTEIIHVIPQEYVVDYQTGIKEPVGRIGVKLGADFNIVTAQMQGISHLKKCLQKANLTLGSLVLESIAAGMSVLSKEEKEAGVAIIDIGGDTTEIAVFHENLIRFTSAVPFGGNVITSDIRQGCRTTPPQAEMLKVKHGKSLANEANLLDVVVIPGLRDFPPKEISVRNLSAIIEARMEEIIEMVYAQILKSGLDRNLAGGIVLTGGGANLQFIKEHFELMTGIGTRIGNPNEYLASANSQIKSPEFATAVGLVLAGFRALDERENRYLKTKNQSPNHNNKRIVQKTENTAKSEKPKEKGKGLFGNWIDKAKGLLMDDMENQGEY
ncbi:MAG: cell division protein FtsA [Verrucomicrobia bacterium]|nr:cell division protein FtsA [Cytophagales bacterium]